MIFLPVSLNGSCMGQNQMMCHNVRLCSRVPSSTVSILPGAPPWSKETIIIAKSSHHSWLIKCHPILHSVSKHLEAKVSIIRKIFPVILDSFINQYTTDKSPQKTTNFFEVIAVLTLLCNSTTHCISSQVPKEGHSDRDLHMG